MSIQPLHDRVVIKRKSEEVNKSGMIVIPDSAAKKPMRGEVVSIGPGKMLDSGKLLPLAVKVGDEVLFNQYSGTDVKVGDIEYVVMREDDILGIVN